MFYVKIFEIGIIFWHLELILLSKVLNMNNIGNLIIKKQEELSKLNSEIEEIDAQIKILNQAIKILDESQSEKLSFIKCPLDYLETQKDIEQIKGICYKGAFFPNENDSILLSIIRILDKEEPLVLEDLALSDFTIDLDVVISLDIAKLKKPIEIRDGIYLETSFDNKTTFQVIKAFLKEFGAFDSDFQIEIKSI